MKQIFAIILTITILSSMIITNVHAVYDGAMTDNSLVESTEVVELLQFIGIDTSEFGGNIVTRSDAAKLYCVTAGHGSIATFYSADFTDISNDKNCTYIAEAFNMGWISAPSYESFNPTGEITAFDFAKGFIHVLGYQETAHKSSYGVIIERLHLTKDVKGGLYAPLTVENALIIIKNALNTPLLKQTVFGDISEYETHRDCTLLSEVHKINTVDGIVNAIAETSLYNAKGAGYGNIEISGVLYKTKENRRGLLGRYVKAYINFENDERYLVAAEINYNKTNEERYTLNRDNSVWVENDLLMFEVSGTDGSKIKQKKRQISSTASFIYNGSYDVNYKLRDIDDICCGDISIIDYDSNNIYDVIVINEYINYHVAGFYENKIFDKNGLPAIDLEDSIIEFVGIEKNGATVFIDELSTSIGKNSIASVFKSNDGRVIKIVLSDLSVFDEISSVQNIGGVELYEIDNNWYETAICGYPDYKLKLSDWGTFYFDAFGRIAGADLKSDKKNYGYYISSKADVFGKNCRFKIITYLGKAQIFDGAEKIQLDTVKKNADDVVNTLGNVCQLISYRTNTKGEIKEINTVGGEINLIDTVSAESNIELGFNSNSQTLGSIYHINSDTVVFNINTNEPTGDPEEDIRAVTPTQIRSRVQCSYDIYDINDMREPACVVLKNNLLTACGEMMYFVRGVRKIMNSNGVVVDSLECVDHTGKETKLYTNSDMVDKIKKGTGIRVRFDKYGFIDKVDDRSVFPVYNKFAESDYTTDFLDVRMYGEILGNNGLSSSCVEGQGVIEIVGDNMFLIEGSPYFYQYSSKVLCVDYKDERDNYFVPISPLELKPGDRVFYIRSNDIIRAIVRR